MAPCSTGNPVGGGEKTAHLKPNKETHRRAEITLVDVIRRVQLGAVLLIDQTETLFNLLSAFALKFDGPWIAYSFLAPAVGRRIPIMELASTNFTRSLARP